MRPVERGPNATVFTNYKQARVPLIEAIGDYCSYCETPHQAAVEHVLPWEGKHSSLDLSWDNFLLACNSCNSYMRNRQDYEPIADAKAARAKYLWPDVDNTARAFEYEPSNRVKVRDDLGPGVLPIAVATHKMLALDSESPTDLRWRRRQDAWLVAGLSAQLVARNPTQEMLDLLGLTARGSGFWSVWRVEFANNPEILKLIDDHFGGTDPSSFHPTTRQPVQRPGGQL